MKIIASCYGGTYQNYIYTFEPMENLDFWQRTWTTGPNGGEQTSVISGERVIQDIIALRGNNFAIEIIED